ncbi:tyrosinase [Colletotrichum musicola]|uniref:tyrosinase n=1 Tax=Colletotrichum musicola TaxID=2175873 RepID=A0A8H6KGA4_9PEZI|nr:tyrosinase [Colletotrichum musicola]
MSVDVSALRIAQARGLTLGVVPKSSDRPLRLEIDDFIQDVELANLYFLALEAFMSKDAAENPFSYYEISGIHGQPWRAWDRVTSASFGPAPGRTNPRSGYCSHGSVVFPTWHRVYLAQFEQALYLHAAAITPRLKAQGALDRFRIPYFDPFIPRQKTTSRDVYTYSVPIILTLPHIQVRRPEDHSRRVSMANPLYHRVPAARDHTIRGLNTTTQAADHSYVIRAFDNAYNPASGLSSQAAAGLWRVMFDGQNWAQMSNHWNPRARRPGEVVYNANSLEGFHDNVHGQFATGPRCASAINFDPSFWLHHCNVDRLLAIWQGIHSREPDSVSWWTSLDVPDGNFVEPGSVSETPRTPLVPFRKGLTPGSGAPVWWTSNDCRDHLALGYDYPETAAARRSADAVRSLTAWANTQLGWLAPRSPRPADEGAWSRLRRQVTQPIPAFPAKVLVDGKTALGAGQAFNGSMAVSPRSLVAAAVPAAPSRPRRILAKAKAAVRSTSPRRKGTNSIKTTETIAVKESTQEQTQNVLARALPEADVDFKRCYGHLGGLANQHKITQWNVTFSVNKFCLDGSFVVYFFLGDFSPEPENWIVEPRLAGSSGVFASSRAAIDDGGWAEIYGHRVFDAGAPDINDEQVARETIPSLKIMVYSETVTLPQDLTEAPRFEHQIVHYDVTHGRPGGLDIGEGL